MKKLIASAALVLMAGAVSADPVVGMWKTQVDDGAYAHVKMAPCGGNFCGTIVRTFDSNGEYKSKNIGKQLVRNMKAKGGGAYSGKVWRPANDKVYVGKISLSGNTMKLSGCVAGGLICAKQTWKRIK